MKLIEDYKKKIENGTASEKELQAFWELLNDSKNEELKEWFQQKWSTAMESNIMELPKQQLVWDKITKELGFASEKKKLKSKTRKLIPYKYIAVASILLVLGITYLFQNNASAFVTLTVAKGEVAKMFVLPDSTKIWLNSASTLSYQKNFTNHRNLILQGEAYFEVYKNKTAPFKVNFCDNLLKVTGTKFNISSYNNNDFTSVHVKEGSVEVYNKRVDTTFLTQNNLLLIDKLKNTQIKNSVDFNDSLLWNQEKLVFKKSKLAQVLKVLERRYNVVFEYNSKKINTSSLLTVQYNNTMTLEEILKGLQILTPIRYDKIDEKTIKIYQN
ncbi:FecR family protein [Wenyingzhuangia aestuarii]|uniref:FecR family protein n=1 Tax=Wenyingzhuangia aestuarii TaxID=1647582 RepID=UPI00143C36F2|nr:FecR family protein [Wenyingzhuangia aestuarii]NJB83283.1 ferric-dicitrate binding protein FerR (iron transport regulator) [Wenyingzhuangia aestuarii]